MHSGIIFQWGYNSDHIGNPFSPLFYPHRSDYPAPFHLMWPRISIQKILDPECVEFGTPRQLNSNIIHYLPPIYLLNQI